MCIVLILVYLELRILIFSEKCIGNAYNGAGNSIITLYSHKGEDLSLDLLHNDSKSLNDYERIWSKIFQCDRKAHRIWNLCYLFFTAISVIKKNNYTLVHILSGYWSSMVVLVAAKLLRKKVVVKITSSLSEAKRPSGLSARIRFRQLLLRFADCIIAISSEISAQLNEISITNEKILRLPNGVDRSRFVGKPGKLVKSSTLKILFCGAVVPRKRLHLLLEALPLLARDIDFHLTIAGPCVDSAYQNKCEEIVKQYSLLGKITWLGFVSNVAPVFNESDLLCLPSKAEGMANVVLEAMASGVPFVVTRSSGMNDMLIHGSGVLVNADPESLSEGILKCVADYEEMSCAGIEAVKAHYDSRAILGRLLSRFHELVE